MLYGIWGGGGAVLGVHVGFGVYFPVWFHRKCLQPQERPWMNFRALGLRVHGFQVYTRDLGCYPSYEQSLVGNYTRGTITLTPNPSALSLKLSEGSLPSSDRPRTLGRGPYSPSAQAKRETER